MEKIIVMKKYGWLLVIAVLLVITGIYLLLPDKEMAPAWEDLQVEQTVEEIQSTVNSESVVLMVDIKGEIKKPGVYELQEGARVKEVVLLAGGFTENAEERQLNLAERLTDQQMIYVPSKEEAENAFVPIDNQYSQSATTDAQININTADQIELQKLSGIGAAKAQAIIDYRETSGPFRKVEDLTEVSGIGEKTVEKLRESIKVQ